MLLLAPVIIVAGVLGRAFVPPGADPTTVPPGADPSTMIKDRIGAETELPHVIDPYARGEDVCLRSLPPELPGVKLQSKWRMCEPWELEAKMRRTRAGEAARPRE